MSFARISIAFLFAPLLAFGATAAEPTSPASVLASLALKARADLQENILPYWLKHSRNPANLGFYGLVRGDNTPVATEKRGSLLTARILWTFSAAYRFDPRPEYKEMADYAYRDLQQHFLDSQHGGYHWSIRADGTPEVVIKQIYTQVFCLYGLSEYHRAFGLPEAKKAALSLYELIDRHAYDSTHGGYFETCSADWSRSSPPKSLIGVPSLKSQNTNLHVLEAMTTLYRIWPDEGLKSRLIELTRLMATRVRDPKTNHLSLFQNADWTAVGDRFSYGHDIEFSWLLWEAAEASGNAELQAEMKPVALAVVDTTIREGMDSDGSVLFEGDPTGVVGRYKEWWAQAEAVVGFVNAYQLSGDGTYLAQATQTWGVIERHLIDREGGDWFLFVTDDRAQRQKAPKVSFWKCPYHTGRACMEIYQRAIKLGALSP